MTNSKIKLTETFQTPKDLPLDINGFDVPNIVMVDFTTARAGYAYNTNRERTDHIEKYTIQGVDEKVYQALKNVGVNMSDVKTINIELTGGFDKIDDKYKPLIAASMHRMIGVDCNTPIKFLLVDVPDGIESAGKGVDFTKLGNASLSIRVAEKLGIPVLNIWDTNISTRLKALVDMLKPKETSEDDEYGF